MQRSKRRNYGWGRNMRWAGEQALREAASRDGGRYSWLSTTLSRWNLFCEFCRSNGIKDARSVTDETLIDYSNSLIRLSPATKQNYISSINTVMKLLAGEFWSSISPSGITKSKRCNIKTSKLAISSINLKDACDEISEKLGKNFEFAVRFAYIFGLRRREALLLEFHIANAQAKACGKIDIIRGTKGGRSRTVSRVIPVPCTGHELLSEACNTFPHERCLLISSSYKSTSATLSNSVLPILRKHGVNRLHDLRADYAIFRYRELTGIEAPRNTCKRTDKVTDQNARRIISLELGHSRPQILNSYIGAYR